MKKLFVRVFKAGVKNTQNPYNEDCSIAISTITKIRVFDDEAIDVWADGRQWGPVDKAEFLKWYREVTI